MHQSFVAWDRELEIEGRWRRTILKACHGQTNGTTPPLTRLRCLRKKIMERKEKVVERASRHRRRLGWRSSRAGWRIYVTRNPTDRPLLRIVLFSLFCSQLQITYFVTSLSLLSTNYHSLRRTWLFSIAFYELHVNPSSKLKLSCMVVRTWKRNLFFGLLPFSNIKVNFRLQIVWTSY